MIRIRRHRCLCFLTAMVVLMQLCAAQAMAVDGELHKKLHHHSDEPGHECAVTMMLSGGYDQVVPDITPVDVVSDPPQWFANLPTAAVFVPSHLVGGVLAHAPPRGP